MHDIEKGERLVHSIDKGSDGSASDPVGADQVKAEAGTCLVSYDMLEVVFKSGTEVWFETRNGQKAGGIVKSTFYDRGCSGEYFMVKVHTLDSDGRHIVDKNQYMSISKFIDSKPLSDLSVQRMTPVVKQRLSARGKLFNRYALGQNHLQYTGIAFMDWGEEPRRTESGRTEFGFQTFRADGRVMVDGECFVRHNANYSYMPSWAMQACDEDLSKPRNASIPADKLWMTAPTIKGFSFSAKRWGELLVESLMPINYRTDAIHSLVMEADRKEMVQALVEHAHESFTDVVEGKGGGCVFLLHGPPGVGKTLTAEATAEKMQKPLYALTVGELGSSVESMETRLKVTLELAKHWDAVLLIDECDIFLERRQGDVTRNAMTGIFLRLLEYHHGVLFLTSNRIKSFDPALYSRITAVLHYRELNHEARAEVWRRLLSAAGLDPAELDVDSLAVDAANGRQIKNAVRFAQVMARRRREEVRTEHCQLASKMAREFQFEDEEHLHL